MELNKIIQGNCLTVLKTLPDNSVDCCITSPPYWGLRDYGHDEQLGGESDFKQFVINLSNVFDEVKRVLKPTGTCFVNLGDTYASGARAKNGADVNTNDPKNPNANRSKVAPNRMGCGLPEKCLCLVPERFSIEMIDRGWILRNTIIWHKPNQMPQSATDRFTVDFEKIFFFVKKSTGYYFEQQLEPAVGYDGRKELNYNGGNKDVSIGKHTRWKKHKNTNDDKGQKPNSMHLKREMGVPDENYFERNIRTTWSVNTEPYSDAHFATYPQRLVERMIKAGCPENGVVIDPFFGSGTTGIYARKVNRNFVGIELNPEYVEIANKRLFKELGMFS